jgi:hypothetical protein
VEAAVLLGVTSDCLPNIESVDKHCHTHGVKGADFVDICVLDMAAASFVVGDNGFPTPPKAPVQHRLARWQTELVDDSEREFLLDGIENGFKIIDQECDLKNVDRRNYPSVYSLNKVCAEDQIKKEIRLGRYIVCDHPTLPEFTVTSTQCCESIPSNYTMIPYVPSTNMHHQE